MSHTDSWGCRPKAAHIDLRCAGRTRRFHLFDTPIGRAVSAQVLSGESYPLIPFLANVRTILDIGANVGAASVYFALHYPSARVLAFEPDSACCRVLRENIVDLPLVRLFDFGLSGRDERAELFLGSVDPATSSLGRSVLASDQSIEVELRDPEPILRELGVEVIDILKLDTEGQEVAILHALEPRLDRTRAIYVEYHDEADRREIDSLLAPTHVLFHGAIHTVHRGELCYVLKAGMPEEVGRLRIGKR
jgi:FkbM family methyltransferase